MGYILWAFAAIVFIYLALSLAVSLFYTSLILHPRGNLSRRTFEQVRKEQSEAGAVDYGAYDAMQKEEFTLHTRAADISCEYLPAVVPTGSVRPKCIIRVHGFSQNRLISVRFIKAFMDLGYHAVIYDQRCFGNSTGEACTMGYREKEDLSAVIDWVKARLGDHTFIGVHGESMGAMTALLALEHEPRIDFVVSDCGLSDLYRGTGCMIRNMTRLPSFPVLPLTRLWMKREMDIRKIRPVDQAAKTDKPVLFLHGTGDRTVPYGMSEEMHRVCRNPLSRLELFEGADHGMSHPKEPERYEGIVREFVCAVETAPE